jgi:hypothetical protein
MRHALALTLGIVCSRPSIALSPTAPSSRRLDDYLHAEFTRLGVHRLNIVSIKGLLHVRQRTPWYERAAVGRDADEHDDVSTRNQRREPPNPGRQRTVPQRDDRCRCYQDREWHVCDD